MTLSSTTENTQRGFTLIELLVVKSIIAILVGFLLPMIGYTRQVGVAMQERPALAALGEELVSQVDVWEHAYFQAARALGEQAALGLEGHVPEPDILFNQLAAQEQALLSFRARIDELSDDLSDPIDKELLGLADGSVRFLLEKTRLVLHRLSWLVEGGPNAGL